MFSLGYVRLKVAKERLVCTKLVKSQSEYRNTKLYDACNKSNLQKRNRKQLLASFKVIYPLKYFKHWPYTVAHTIDCVCSKMLNHGLNHGLFLSLFKLIPCPIHWIVYVLAYLNFIFEFSTSCSTAQNGPLCPDT